MIGSGISFASLSPIAYLGVRANAGWLTVSRDEDVDDIRYDGDLKLSSYGAMLAWYAGLF